MQYPYPENLISVICPELQSVTADQLDGFSYAFSQILPREQMVLRLYYEEHKLQREIAKLIDVSDSRVHQLLQNGYRKLRNARLVGYIRYGLAGFEEEKKRRAKELSMSGENLIAVLDAVLITELPLSNRLARALKWNGITTLGDIERLRQKGLRKLMLLRGVGRKSVEEILAVLEDVKKRLGGSGDNRS